jgi:TolB-like protein
MADPPQKDQEIIKQVDRICDSPEFKAKKRLCRFLRFIVDETLSGRDKELKGYVIATSVFDRDKDFDPDHDPIVRIQAGRLRRSLEIYYLREGRNDPIHIIIPRGAYKAIFLPVAEVNKSNMGTIRQVDTPSKRNTSEPTIGVLPFKNLTGNPDKEYFIYGFGEELAVELAQYEDLIVVDCQPPGQSAYGSEDFLKNAQKGNIHFVLEGSVRLEEDTITIVIKLIDLNNNEQIWAERFQRSVSANNLVAIQEEIAQNSARILGTEYGIILNRLSQESLRRKPKQLDTYDAILRFYYYESHMSRELAISAMHALERAIKIDPNCGIAHAMLASIYGSRYALDAPGSEDALTKMVSLAEQALQLEPNRVFVHIVYAWRCFICNERQRFLNAIDRCLSMNLNTPLRMGLIGFYLSLFGEWEKGKELLDRAMHYKTGYPLYFYAATMLYFYRNRDYESAWRESQNFQIPDLFWGPMLRAAVLGQLGRLEAAQTEIQQLKSLNPDFESKAGDLISRFVKETDLVEHIIDGLSKAGMKNLVA